MSIVDSGMIEHGNRIGSHLFNRVRAKRLVASTGTAVVVGDHAVARGKNEPLHIPHVLICTKTLNHQDRRS